MKKFFKSPEESQRICFAIETNKNREINISKMFCGTIKQINKVNSFNQVKISKSELKDAFNVSYSYRRG